METEGISLDFRGFKERTEELLLTMNIDQRHKIVGPRHNLNEKKKESEKGSCGFRPSISKRSQEIAS